MLTGQKDQCIRDIRGRWGQCDESARRGRVNAEAARVKLEKPPVRGETLFQI